MNGLIVFFILIFVMLFVGNVAYTGDKKEKTLIILREVESFIEYAEANKDRLPADVALELEKLNAVAKANAL